MAKKGMKRFNEMSGRPSSDAAAKVPEIQGKVKHGNEKANPIIEGTESPSLKVYHTTPYKKEKKISDAYPVIDNDLARDNLENDITAADLQDL